MHAYRIKIHRFYALNVVRIRATCPAVSVIASRSPSITFFNTFPLNLSGCHRSISDRIALALSFTLYVLVQWVAYECQNALPARCAGHPARDFAEREARHRLVVSPQCRPCRLVIADSLGQAQLHSVHTLGGRRPLALTMLPLPLLSTTPLLLLLLLLHGPTVGLPRPTSVLFEQSRELLPLRSLPGRLCLLARAFLESRSSRRAHSASSAASTCAFYSSATLNRSWRCA